MAPRTRGDENESFLVDTVDEQPVRLDMALPVPAVRPAQCVVTHGLGQGLPAHERLEGQLELGDVLALPLYALVVLLELRREP